MANVPRISDITGKKSQDALRDEREWARCRRDFQNDQAKNNYGTPESKEAWKRRINKTRSR